jgi:hypothetical protein
MYSCCVLNCWSQELVQVLGWVGMVDALECAAQHQGILATTQTSSSFYSARPLSSPSPLSSTSPPTPRSIPGQRGGCGSETTLFIRACGEEPPVSEPCPNEGIISETTLLIDEEPLVSEQSIWSPDVGSRVLGLQLVGSCSGPGMQGQQGVCLSQGQQQLMCLARMLLNNR